MKETKFHPTRANREESFLVTRDDLREYLATREWDDLQNRFRAAPKERWFSSAVVTAENRWRSALIAHALGIDIPQSPETSLANAFSAYFMCIVAEVHRHRIGKIDWKAPHDEFKEAPWLMAVAAEGGAHDACDLLAPYFLKVSRSGGASRAEWTDIPLYSFFKHLLEAHVSGIWPDEIDEHTLEGYAGVLKNAGDAQLLQAALIDCCDHRMAHTWRFDGIDAPKRYPASTTKSAFQGRSIGAILVPYELLYFRYVYEKVVGRPISLDADHPLLKTEAMRVPSVWPLREDAFCAELFAFFDRDLGPGWREN
jgi:hypothetical protein